MDGRKSTGYNDAFQAADCLATIFNNYDKRAVFQPQNLMVKYNDAVGDNPPKRKDPYAARTDEWLQLADHTHEIDPNNTSRRYVLRDGAWIKSTWNDVRKWLHSIFMSYNRSGQHDPDRGEWGSATEQQRWVRNSTNKVENSIRFPSVMLYSIAVLELADFQGIKY